MSGATAAEIAAFLGVTSSAVRHAVRAHGIAPIGKAGKAHLYDARTVVREMGAHDRRATCKPAVDASH